MNRINVTGADHLLGAARKAESAINAFGIAYSVGILNADTEQHAALCHSLGLASIALRDAIELVDPSPAPGGLIAAFDEAETMTAADFGG